MADKARSLLFKFFRGVTFNRAFSYSDSGGAIDLTGSVIVFHIRKKDQTVDFFTLSSTSSPNVSGSVLEIDSDPLLGKFQLKISNEDTLTFDFDLGEWWTSREIDGDVDKIGEGPITVKLP